MTAKVQDFATDLEENILVPLPQAEDDFDDDYDEDDDAELEYYYDDGEPYYDLRTRRGDMPNPVHSNVVDYLIQVLRWLFLDRNYTIEREVNFHETLNYKDLPRYPDVFVMKHASSPNVMSYKVNITDPAPEFIVEVISETTRRVDLVAKPKVYARWGVQEYFAYDPRARRRKRDPRLRGWRLVNGAYQELTPELDGRMWSEQIESWLVPDGPNMYLTDADGNRRLTKAEALEQENELLRQEVERLRKLAANGKSSGNGNGQHENGQH